MAELASKFNVGCVIQYYSDQCSETDRNYDSCFSSSNKDQFRANRFNQVFSVNVLISGGSRVKIDYSSSILSSK